jgi:hypothetical protein
VLCTGLTKNLYAQNRTMRLAMFGYANGSHPGLGAHRHGADFVLKPHMAPLEAIRKDIIIMRGMTLERAAATRTRAPRSRSSAWAPRPASTSRSRTS